MSTDKDDCRNIDLQRRSSSGIGAALPKPAMLNVGSPRSHRQIGLMLFVALCFWAQLASVAVIMAFFTAGADL